nr:hypothetical protein [Tanacetum cinerariifolium]
MSFTFSHPSPLQEEHQHLDDHHVFICERHYFCQILMILKFSQTLLLRPSTFMDQLLVIMDHPSSLCIVVVVNLEWLHLKQQSLVILWKKSQLLYFAFLFEFFLEQFDEDYSLESYLLSRLPFWELLRQELQQFWHTIDLHYCVEEKFSSCSEPYREQRYLNVLDDKAIGASWKERHQLKLKGL